MPGFAAEARLDECGHKVPGDLRADRAASHAEDVHVVILHALLCREVIVDETGPRSQHLIGTEGGSHSASADGNATLALAGGHGAGKGENKIRVVVCGIQRVGAEVHHLVTLRLEALEEFLLQSKSAMIRRKSDSHSFTHARNRGAVQAAGICKIRPVGYEHPLEP